MREWDKVIKLLNAVLVKFINIFFSFMFVFTLLKFDFHTRKFCPKDVRINFAFVTLKIVNFLTKDWHAKAGHFMLVLQ